MDSSKIQALFDQNSNYMLFVCAARELCKRGDDVSFTFIHFLNLALSEHRLERAVGWTGLKDNFRGRLPRIGFSEFRPSKETIAKLKEFQKQWNDK